jgi:hypothetical protein
MDLPFQDSAETSGTRRIVLDEIARVRGLFSACLSPEGPDTFDWKGAEHWVDRPRCLALKMLDKNKFPGVTTLPDNEASEDVLDHYGGESRAVDAIEVIDVFSWLVSDTLEKRNWLPAVTHVVNVVMVQPLVNPAAEPLFWVAMNDVLDDREESGDLMRVMRPLCFDMKRYPASRGDAPAVREAQAEYFRKWATPPSDWATLDDAAWAQACARLVADASAGIEMNVWDLITQRATAIREGRRDR